MPKRKLDEISNANGFGAGATQRQRQQFDGLLEQGRKALSQSLKIARGFERQKLGRRQKAAKREEHEAEEARLGAEVLALKVCDSLLHLEIR